VKIFTILSTIVAPSFVTMTSESYDMSILSIPFGPNEVFNVFAIVTAAMMFF